MRPPKRPEPTPSHTLPPRGGGEGGRAASLEEVLASIRTRPSFGAEIEMEALEKGGYTVVLTRFRKPVLEKLKEWEAAFPGYKPEWPAELPQGLFRMRVSRGDAVFYFFVNGAQAYRAEPIGSVREILSHPHDFIPEEIRGGAGRPPSCEHLALSLRVHLAGGSDQWVSRPKLDKFLASGRDGPLTGLDWGQLPE